MVFGINIPSNILKLWQTCSLPNIQSYTTQYISGGIYWYGMSDSTNRHVIIYFFYDYIPLKFEMFTCTNDTVDSFLINLKYHHSQLTRFYNFIKQLFDPV